MLVWEEDMVKALRKERESLREENARLRAALQRESQQAEQARLREIDCATLEGECAALRQRVEELERGMSTLDEVADALRYFAGRRGYLPTLAEHAALVIRERDAAEARLKITSETAQADLARAEAAEAKLARVVEALSEYVSEDAAFAEDHLLCGGDCDWSARHKRARAALAAAKGKDDDNSFTQATREREAKEG